MSRASALLVSAIVVAGCGSAQPSRASNSAFTIDFPPQGAIVATSPVAVGGKAPAGSRVVQDISFASDVEAIAGTDGRWQILAELKQGANDLVFRLGNDRSTELHLGLTYDPSSATPAPSSVAAASGPPSTSESVPTVGPTIAPPTATLPPSLPPTPAPTAPPSFRTFGDGIWEVGPDIKAGTYRTRDPAFGCYWARLRGFDGTLNDIIANENLYFAYGVVTIKSSDAGFESSGCEEWSSDLSRVTDSKTYLDWDGTYIVGTDLTAGKWKSTGGDSCYWARLSAFTGTLGAIIANGIPSGPAIVTIRSTDKGFSTFGCGEWTRQ